MTRKHFELVAKAMRESRPPHSNSECGLSKQVQWRNDVEQLIRAFTTVNERFDANRFRQAVGVEWDCQSCRFEHGEMSDEEAQC